MAGRKPKLNTLAIKNYMSLFSRKYPSRKITVNQLVEFINNETDCDKVITYKNINNNSEIKQEIESFNKQLQNALISNKNGVVSVVFDIDDALGKCSTQSGARELLSQLQEIVSQQNDKLESLLLESKRAHELEEIIRERQALDSKSEQYKKQNIELRKQNKELVSLNKTYKEFIIKNLTEQSFAQYLIEQQFLILPEGQSLPESPMKTESCMTINDSIRDAIACFTENEMGKDETSNVIGEDFVKNWREKRKEK